jgi:plasminogen activator
MTAKNDTFDYWVTPHVKIFTEVTYTYYPNNKGEIKQWDNSGSQSENN